MQLYSQRDRHPSNPTKGLTNVKHPNLPSYPTDKDFIRAGYKALEATKISTAVLKLIKSL
jgi:hypothetical protein